MNGETIITAENIALAADIIAAELPDRWIYTIYGATTLRRYATLFITDDRDQSGNAPTLAELRDEVRERFREYLQEEK